MMASRMRCGSAQAKEDELGLGYSSSGARAIVAVSPSRTHPATVRFCSCGSKGVGGHVILASFGSGLLTPVVGVARSC